jgi:hypothetical protein
MTQLQKQTRVLPILAEVVLSPDAKQQLSIEEIAKAVGLHFVGENHTYEHRYAEDLKCQQVQRETIYEKQDGKKFRVVTEYHEVFTIVDVVDNSHTH